MRWILIGLMLCGSLAWAEAEDAIEKVGDLLARGEYEKAVIIVKPLAEQGHRVAQAALGAMHYQGNGVPQDYSEAMKWWRRAAEQGHLQSQYNVGLMHSMGRGVPQDDTTAYAWFALATNNGLAQANENRVKVIKRIVRDARNTEEAEKKVEEALKKAEDLVGKYGAR